MNVFDFLDRDWHLAWRQYREAGDPLQLARLVRERERLPAPVRELCAELLIKTVPKGKGKVLLRPEHYDILRNALLPLLLDPVASAGPDEPDDVKAALLRWQGEQFDAAVLRVSELSGARRSTVRQRLDALVRQRRQLGERNRAVQQEIQRRKEMRRLRTRNYAFSGHDDPMD